MKSLRKKIVKNTRLLQQLVIKPTATRYLVSNPVNYSIKLLKDPVTA